MVLVTILFLRERDAASDGMKDMGTNAHGITLFQRAIAGEHFT